MASTPIKTSGTNSVAFDPKECTKKIIAAIATPPTESASSPIFRRVLRRSALGPIESGMASIPLVRAHRSLYVRDDEDYQPDEVGARDISVNNMQASLRVQHPRCDAVWELFEARRDHHRAIAHRARRDDHERCLPHESEADEAIVEERMRYRRRVLHADQIENK